MVGDMKVTAQARPEKGSQDPRAKTSVKRATAVESKRPVKSPPKSAPPAKASADKVVLPTKTRTKTLRLEPTFEVGLAMLKEVLHKPINKMVNEAVGEYIVRRTAEVESQLTTTLAELQAYRRAHPDFMDARQAFIDAEAKYGGKDPMEGRLVTVTRPPGLKAGSKARAEHPRVAPRKGQAVSTVRDLLRR
jgi:hypothetical protein